MPKRHTPPTRGTDDDAGPTARDEDPFDDDSVTPVLDAAWDDIQS